MGSSTEARRGLRHHNPGTQAYGAVATTPPSAAPEKVSASLFVYVPWFPLSRGSRHIVFFFSQVYRFLSNCRTCCICFLRPRMTGGQADACANANLMEISTLPGWDSLPSARSLAASEPLVYSCLAYQRSTFGKLKLTLAGYGYNLFQDAFASCAKAAGSVCIHTQNYWERRSASEKATEKDVRLAVAWHSCASCTQ